MAIKGLPLSSVVLVHYGPHLLVGGVGERNHKWASRRLPRGGTGRALSFQPSWFSWPALGRRGRERTQGSTAIEKKRSGVN